MLLVGKPGDHTLEILYYAALFDKVKFAFKLAKTFSGSSGQSISGSFREEILALQNCDTHWSEPPRRLFQHFVCISFGIKLAVD